MSISDRLGQIEDRADAAKARTASTVTREEVSKVVHGVFSTWCDNEDMVDAVCALFGVEAEPADPVEAKARELFDEAGRGDSKIEFHEILPGHRGEYLRIAAHVLGQEAGDGR